MSYLANMTEIWCQAQFLLVMRYEYTKVAIVV